MHGWHYSRLASRRRMPLEEKETGKGKLLLILTGIKNQSSKKLRHLRALHFSNVDSLIKLSTCFFLFFFSSEPSTNFIADNDAWKHKSNWCIPHARGGNKIKFHPRWHIDSLDSTKKTKKKTRCWHLNWMPGPKRKNRQSEGESEQTHTRKNRLIGGMHWTCTARRVNFSNPLTTERNPFSLWRRKNGMKVQTERLKVQQTC